MNFLHRILNYFIEIIAILNIICSQLILAFAEEEDGKSCMQMLALKLTSKIRFCWFWGFFYCCCWGFVCSFVFRGFVCFLVCLFAWFGGFFCVQENILFEGFFEEKNFSWMYTAKIPCGPGHRDSAHSLLCHGTN